MTGELAWLTDIDLAEAAWAIALENDLSANFLEFQHGHLQILPKYESRDSQDGKQG